LLVATTASLAADIESGGIVGANTHLGVLACDGYVGDCPFLEFQDLGVAGGFVRGEPSQGVGFEIDALFRLHQGTGVVEVAEADQVASIQPWSLDLNSAWVEAQGDHVDVRIGQQRFAWGVADGINPVDIVNPYDLRDPTRFDRRLGIPAARVKLHGGQAALELAYMPLFRPARIPADLDILDNAEDLFDFADVGGGDVDIDEFETRTEVPDNRLGFNSVAARASVAAPFADLAAMVYYGRDSLPNVGGEARLVGFGGSSVDVGVPVKWPSQLVGGLEARGPLFLDIAGWVEGALVVPERLVVTSSRAQLDSLVTLAIIDEVPDPLPETVIQDGEPYVRAVVGVERFFGRVVVNLQWLHGLPTERTSADMSDYATLGVLINASDLTRITVRSITDGSGVLAGADIEVLHADALAIKLGTTIVVGDPASALGQIMPLSNVSGGVELRF